MINLFCHLNFMIYGSSYNQIYKYYQDFVTPLAVFGYPVELPVDSPELRIEILLYDFCFCPLTLKILICSCNIFRSPTCLNIRQYKLFKTDILLFMIENLC